MTCSLRREHGRGDVDRRVLDGSIGSWLALVVAQTVAGFG